MKKPTLLVLFFIYISDICTIQLKNKSQLINTEK